MLLLRTCCLPLSALSPLQHVSIVTKAPESQDTLQELAMKEFFINVTRYPRYLIAFSLGVINSVAEPLARRRSNPVTAVALIGALISGFLSLSFVLRAMVSSAPQS